MASETAAVPETEDRHSLALHRKLSLMPGPELLNACGLDEVLISAKRSLFTLLILDDTNV